MQKLSERIQQSGDLEGALLVRDEIKTFAEEKPRDFSARPDLARLRAVYEESLPGLKVEVRGKQAGVARQTKEQLKALSVSLTQAGDLDQAERADTWSKELAEEWAGSPQPVDDKPFSGQIHVVAKGEIQLGHNGRRVSFRNAASERQKYVDGATQRIDLSPGDVITLRMRSTVVYRGFIVAVENAEGDRFISFGADDFRYLGEGRNPERDTSDPEELLAITARPERGGPDPEMTDAWRKKPISELARSASEWLRCGPGSEWHHYAAVIRPEMIRTGSLAGASQ